MCHSEAGQRQGAAAAEPGAGRFRRRATRSFCTTIKSAGHVPLPSQWARGLLVTKLPVRRFAVFEVACTSCLAAPHAHEQQACRPPSAQKVHSSSFDSWGCSASSSALHIVQSKEKGRFRPSACRIVQVCDCASRQRWLLFMLHVKLYVPRCGMFHIACRALMLHGARCMLRAACCTWYAVRSCRMLHITCSILHVVDCACRLHAVWLHAVCCMP